MLSLDNISFLAFCTEMTYLIDAMYLRSDRCGDDRFYRLHVLLSDMINAGMFFVTGVQMHAS